VVGVTCNTARVHLEVLVAAGLVSRRLEKRRVRGRPRVLYEAARRTARSSGEGLAGAGYRDLARLLAGQIAESTDVRSQAFRAGARWASALEARPLPARPLSSGEAVAAATELLDELGFEPELDPTTDPGRILLHHCPFAEVAREHRSVICGVHLGMLEAAFERFDASVVVDGLDSFVEDDPLLCVVRLGDKGALRQSPRRRRR